MVKESEEFNGIVLQFAKRFYCDKCGKECDPYGHTPELCLFHWDGDDLCWECLLDIADIKKVE